MVPKGENSTVYIIQCAKHNKIYYISCYSLFFCTMTFFAFVVLFMTCMLAEQIKYNNIIQYPPWRCWPDLQKKMYKRYKQFPVDISYSICYVIYNKITMQLTVIKIFSAN